MTGHNVTIQIKDDELRAAMLGYAKEIIVAACRSELQSQIDKAIADAPEKAIAKFMSTWDGSQLAKKYQALMHDAMLARLVKDPEWQKDLVQAVNTIAQSWFNSTNTSDVFTKAISNQMDNKYKHLLSGLTDLLELIETRKAELQDMISDIQTMKGQPNEPSA